MSDAALRSPTVNVFRRMVRSWNHRDWWQFGALVTAILVLHLVGFGTLFVLIARITIRSAPGLRHRTGLTAAHLRPAPRLRPRYIAAIDNTCRRRLMANPNQSGSGSRSATQSWCWRSPSWWSWPPGRRHPAQRRLPGPAHLGSREPYPPACSSYLIGIINIICFWVSGGSSRACRSA